MVVDERPQPCRLKTEEIEYLNKHNFSFSDYVHNSIKRDMELTTLNKKKNFLKDQSYNVIMLGFGAIFLFFAMTLAHVVGFIIMLFMGGFFLLSSLFNIGWEVYQKLGRNKV